MKKLLLKGVELPDLAFLAMSTRVALLNNDDSTEQRMSNQLVQNLKIDDSLVSWARDLTRRHSPTDLHPSLFFHMPFYPGFEENIVTHNPGVAYEWRVARGIGEVFDIKARMHPRSQLANRMDQAVSMYDSSGEAVSRAKEE